MAEDKKRFIGVWKIREKLIEINEYFWG